MFKNLVIGFLVAILLIVAWNPIIAPAGRAVGRFVSGGIAALNGQAAPTTAAPVVKAPPAAGTATATVVPAPTAVTAPAEAPDGPRYEETEVGFNVWGNGQKVVWSEIPKPEGEGQYLVAHGDLKADGKASIKAFVSVLEAKKYLKDGTWKLNLVTVVETGSIEEYLDALAERLGEDYKIQH